MSSHDFLSSKPILIERYGFGLDSEDLIPRSDGHWVAYCEVAPLIAQLQSEIAFWRRDSAAAWDKCEERRKENETLRASEPPDEWQPIATAPKDGRRFLAVGMGPQFFAHWGSGANIWQDDTGAYREPRYWKPMPEGPCLAAVTKNVLHCPHDKDPDDCMHCADRQPDEKVERCQQCEKPLPPLAQWSMPSCPECVDKADRQAAETSAALKIGDRVRVTLNTHSAIPSSGWVIAELPGQFRRTYRLTHANGGDMTINSEYVVAESEEARHGNV